MAKSNKSADTGEGETSAPVTPVGKTKLHYAFNTTSVNIIEHTAEKASEMKKDHIVQEHSFSIADVPDVLQDGDIQKSLAGYGLQKLLQDRTSGTKDAGAKLAEMKVLFSDYFTAGLWKSPAKASSGGTRGRKISATLAQAVGGLLDMTPIEAEANLKAADKEAFDALCKNPKVIAAVAEIEASVVVSEDALSDLL